MGAAGSNTVLLLIIPMSFLTISIAISAQQTREGSELESRRVFDVNGGPDSVVWVVQLSDLHFSVHHPDRAADFKRLIGPALSMIKPSLVLLTGDLTDGKSKDMLTMKQDKQEWLEYRNVMDNVVKKSGLNKEVFYDLRGNHDSFGVPFVGGSFDFFSNYSLNALLGRLGKVNSVTLQTEERRHVFVGIDSSMAVGLRGPTNLFGHPTDKLLADMDSELSQWSSDPTKPVTKISFGHFPISFSAASESGKTLKDVLLKHSVSAYLCGHLHASFGKNLKRLHRSGNDLVQINTHGSPSGRQNCSPGAPPIQEFWEWEMGDWRKNRAMRIVAIDKGRVSFYDMEYKSGAKKTIVLPTFPLDSRMMWTSSSLHDYECQTTEPLPLSNIRALVFSVSPIASVVARIYDSSPGELALVMEDLMKKHEDNGGVLYTAVWNYKAYEDPSALRYWIQIEAIDKLGRSTLSELRPFSVNGRTKEVSWAWKEVMVMGCQWAAFYSLFLWISIGFSVLILVMIISLSLPIVVKKWQSLLADRGFIKAGRIISELHRLNSVWFSMLAYIFYLMIFPWFSGQVFTDGGQRLYLTYKGWIMKSAGANGKAEFAGFPDVMVVILPHLFFVVVPSILVALSLAVEREMYRLSGLSFSRKKKDDNNEVKKIGSGFHVRRWIRKLLMLISLAIFLKHYKSCRAMSRAFEMNPLLHFPGYTLVMPLLLLYAFYETRRI
ncbi:hypothetical protein V2J09_023681 [Rumex salicifolius]